MTTIERASTTQRRMARRAFLTRTAALTAAVTTGSAAGIIGSATAASAGPGLTPRAVASRLPKFGPGAWVEPRPEAVADITELSIAEAAWMYRRGRLTPTELVEAYVDRIDAFDSTYLAFYRVLADEAIAQAGSASLNASSPLAGIPLAVKDNFFTEGIETTAGSFIFEGFVPPYDATAVARLTAAGAIVLGKTQMGPLATTRATTPDGRVTTVNAWTPQNPSVNPGGSSTGSATATAARMATSSIGTQTGGSITGPSNAQGLTGLKPTMGRASIYGVIPLTYTRDHPGPLARSAMDAAIVTTAMAGPDENDPRTLGLPAVPDLIGAAQPFRRGGKVAVRERTRLGVIPGYVSGAAAAQRQAFLDTMAGIDGVEVVDVTLPDEWSLLTGTFNAVRLPERTEPFIGMLKDDLTQFGVSLTSWLQGLFLSGDEWITGQRAKVVLLERIMDDLLEQCDVVVQTSPVPFDIVGLPELALPIGFGTSGGAEVPVGTILGAGPYEEDRLLAVAAAYQAVTDHHWRRPPDPSPSTSALAESALRLTPEEVAELTD
jgi:Asp-tRNA(Asn)/Glu-tRNA(Gln) amidotransferase A subunit family amidase